MPIPNTPPSAADFARLLARVDTLERRYGSAPPRTLDGLDDVNADYPAVGDSIAFDGSKWVNGLGSGPSRVERLRMTLHGVTEGGGPGPGGAYTGVGSWSHNAGASLTDLSTPTEPRFRVAGDYSVSLFAESSGGTAAAFYAFLDFDFPDTPILPSITTFSLFALLGGLLTGFGIAGFPITLLLPPTPYGTNDRFISNYILALGSAPDPIDVSLDLLIIQTKGAPPA